MRGAYDSLVYEEEARAVADALVRGDYGAVRAWLPESLSDRIELSEQGLRSTMQRTTDSIGQVRQIGEPKSFTTVELPVTFDQGKATLRVSFDQSGSLVGLFLTPSWG